MAVPAAAQGSSSRSVRPPVAVQVFSPFRGKVEVRALRAAARAALAAGGATAPIGVSVVVADDQAVRSLNARYRGLDEVTDVLAFGWAAGPRPSSFPGRIRAGSSPNTWNAFPEVPGEATGMGEVVLSYPQAAHQAAEKGHSPQEEVALLVVHGVLHLLGHDHVARGEEARMRALEAAALERLGIKSTLLTGGGRGR